MKASTRNVLITVVTIIFIATCIVCGVVIFWPSTKDAVKPQTPPEAQSQSKTLPKTQSQSSDRFIVPQKKPGSQPPTQHGSQSRTERGSDSQSSSGRIIVMRHSVKQDPDVDFADKETRPYDLHIADKQLPLNQLQEMESNVPNLNITKIISSPFRRCIQTSVIIAKELGIKTISIDTRIGETGKGIYKDFDVRADTVTYYSKEQLENEHDIVIEWMDKDHKPKERSTKTVWKGDLDENDQQYEDFEKKEFPKLFAEKGGDTLIVSHAVPCNQWSGEKYWISECGWIAFKNVDGKSQDLAHSSRCSLKKMTTC